MSGSVGSGAVLMVVFGAGASFDSVSMRTIQPASDTALKFKPPLARQLFEARESFGEFIDRNSRCRALVGHLRRTNDGRTVEAQLAEYDNEALNDPIRAQQLAATRFYLRDIIESTTRQWSDAAHGVTNYVQLVDLIEHKRAAAASDVVYVTFNYDTMLEEAMQSVTGQRFDSIDDYAMGATPVFKVHGSTDWGYPVLNADSVLAVGDVRQSARWGVDRIAAMVPGPIEKAQFTSVYIGSQHTEYLPAVALPVLNKGAESFTLPAEHASALRDCAGRVDSLLVIGWAAADGHFLDLLQDARCKPARTLIVAGAADDATRVLGELTRVQNQGLNATEWGFSSLLDRGAEALDGFLAAAL